MLSIQNRPFLVVFLDMKKRNFFSPTKFPSAFDIKLRTEYLEALDVLEVVEATDFVSVAAVAWLMLEGLGRGAQT